MRTWQTYYAGALRLANKYAPGDEDVQQTAALGMLMGMMVVWMHNKVEPQMTRAQEDETVRSHIEDHIRKLISADSDVEVHEQTADGSAEYANVWWERQRSPVLPPDEIYEAKLKVEHLHQHVLDLPHVNRDAIFKEYWRPEMDFLGKYPYLLASEYAECVSEGIRMLKDSVGGDELCQ